MVVIVLFALVFYMFDATVFLIWNVCFTNLINFPGLQHSGADEDVEQSETNSIVNIKR